MRKEILFASIVAIFGVFLLVGCLKTISDLTGDKLDIAEQVANKVIEELGYGNMSTLNAGYKIVPVSNSLIKITSSGEISVPGSVINYIKSLSVQASVECLKLATEYKTNKKIINWDNYSTLFKETIDLINKESKTMGTLCNLVLNELSWKKVEFAIVGDKLQTSPELLLIYEKLSDSGKLECVNIIVEYTTFGKVVNIEKYKVLIKEISEIIKMESTTMAGLFDVLINKVIEDSSGEYGYGYGLGSNSQTGNTETVVIVDETWDASGVVLPEITSHGNIVLWTTPQGKRVDTQFEDGFLIGAWEDVVKEKLENIKARYIKDTGDKSIQTANVAGTICKVLSYGDGNIVPNGIPDDVLWRIILTTGHEIQFVYGNRRDCIVTPDRSSGHYRIVNVRTGVDTYVVAQKSQGDPSVAIREFDEDVTLEEVK